MVEKQKRKDELLVVDDRINKTESCGRIFSLSFDNYFSPLKKTMRIGFVGAINPDNGYRDYN
jgi:hypothetical protein